MPPMPTSARSSCARSASACTWRTRSRASRPGKPSARSACSTARAPRMPWRRRAVLRRNRAGAGGADGLSAAHRQHRPQFQLQPGDAGVRQVLRADQLASEVCNILRRAFTKLRNGRGGPVIVEIPTDMWNEEVGAAQLHAGAAHPLRRRSRGCEGSRRAADRGQAAGDLCRPGRALRAKPGRS